MRYKIKYKFTQKALDLFPGLSIPIIETGNTYESESIEPKMKFHNDNVKYLLESGAIEEIQKPEFTKLDMIDFANHCYHTRRPSMAWMESFNDWLIKRKRP